MIRDVTRLWAVTGLAIVIGTKGFVRSPCVARVAEVRSRAACSSVLKRAPSPGLARRRCSSAALQGCGELGRSSGGAMFSAQQSVDGGVMLPPAEEVDEYARFLSDAIRQHLDEEWTPQDCHREIGEEVARLYGVAIEQGVTELSTLVLDVGSAMEKFDMGDAFVGPWDIANRVSDFVMDRMGAETSGCSTKAPAASSSSGDAAAVQTNTFRLTTEMVRQVQSDLASDFSRYLFLVGIMEEETGWEQANTVMAVYQGYTPEDADGDGAPGVRRGWARAFPGPSPPDLDTAEYLVDALEADFPEDPDMLEGLEVIVETVYGGEAKRMDAGDAEKGIPPNPVYLRRSTVVKWLYLMGFLQDDIRRVPDDPEQLADLVAGRARLKTQTKT